MYIKVGVIIQVVVQWIKCEYGVFMHFLDPSWSFLYICAFITTLRKDSDQGVAKMAMEALEYELEKVMFFHVFQGPWSVISRDIYPKLSCFITFIYWFHSLMSEDSIDSIDTA